MKLVHDINRPQVFSWNDLLGGHLINLANKKAIYNFLEDLHVSMKREFYCRKIS